MIKIYVRSVIILPQYFVERFDTDTFYADIDHFEFCFGIMHIHKAVVLSQSVDASNRHKYSQNSKGHHLD